MKVFIRAISLITLLITSIGQGEAYAHQGHNEISSETAINIAHKSVKQLTFKDFGYDVGKLDVSWKSLNDSSFSVLEVLEKRFIIVAINGSNDQTIYFEITKNGKVVSVKSDH